MRGTVNFYSHALWQNVVLESAVRLFSPRYAHCSLTCGQWVFQFNRDGYEILKPGTRTPAATIDVELQDPQQLLKWENPKPYRLGRLGLALSVVLPLKNCAKEIGKAVGVRARTPDSLYETLKREKAE